MSRRGYRTVKGLHPQSDRIFAACAWRDGLLPRPIAFSDKKVAVNDNDFAVIGKVAINDKTIAAYDKKLAVIGKNGAPMFPRFGPPKRQAVTWQAGPPRQPAAWFFVP